MSRRVWNVARGLGYGVLAVSLGVGCGSKVEEAAPAASATATVEAPKGDELRDEIDDVLRFTLERKMSAQEHAAWQVVHGILAFGPHLKIDAAGQEVSALDYLLGGGSLVGWNLRATAGGGVEAIVESGTKTGQGHKDQWLGYLSQIGIPAERELVVNGRKFVVGDMVRQAQAEVYDGMEATWTLMACTQYLKLDAKWQGRGGEWTIERLVAMEAAQDINSSACGGSHRLYGLASILNRYVQEGGQLTGGWAAADKKIQDAIAKARQFQQPDGSLSAKYFERSASSPDIALRMGTTGHVLEFVVLAANQQQIQEQWVARAAHALCGMFEQTRDLPVECGALYHAAHGLYLYRLRMWGEPDFLKAPATSAEPAAERPEETTAQVDVPAAEETITP